MYPYSLGLLLLLPCFIWCKLKVKILYFSKPEWLPSQDFALNYLTLWLMAIHTLLVISLANPYRYDTQLASQKKGRDLVLVMDTSGSMAERGFNQEDASQTKYDISMALGKDFIAKRYDDNIGLVVFGSYALTSSPLTYDLKALAEMFELMSDIGIAGTSTAIGNALLQGIGTVEAGEAKSKILILLTDGQHNAGKTSPHQATNEAIKKGIKIYTIGIGKKGDYDQELLSKIANETSGQSFEAQSSQELKKVYKHIEDLEPSTIRSENYLNQENLFIYPLFLAILGLFVLLIYQEEQL